MKKTMIFVIATITILSGACSPIRSGYSCPVSQRMPIGNPYFQIRWSRPGIIVYPDPFNTLMQGVASKVFVLTGKDFEYGGSKILAFDTQSGTVLWQRSVILPGDFMVSKSQLYVGLYDKLEIVDPQAGNSVKTIEFSKVGSVYNLFAAEHNLYAFTTSGRSLTYNIEDGTYSLSEPFLPYHPFLLDNGITYFSEGSIYKAQDVETQSVLWEYPLYNETLSSRPLFADNLIILLTRMGSIYGLDKKNGKLLWRLDPNVISNIAANKSQLFFLTNDGYLKVIDANNGQEIAKLEFDPASFELSSPSSDNIIGAYDLWVDTENDMLIVSFGDSCQLIGIKLQLP